jgi:CO/xanthine dehydrogenase FAD-binding subunit
MDLHYPGSLDAAGRCLADGATPFGGGTLLLPVWQREGYPPRCFSLRDVPEAILTGSGRVGAAVTLDRAGTLPTRALRQAVAALGTAPLRAQATVAGNLAGSGPRCLLPVFLALGARARVLTEHGSEQHDLDRALSQKRVLLDLEWDEPEFSAYRKIRTGRSGLPSLAVATALHASPDSPAHVHIAVWRDRKVFCAAVHTHDGADEAFRQLQRTRMADFPPRDTAVIRAQVAEAIEKGTS